MSPPATRKRLAAPLRRWYVAAPCLAAALGSQVLVGRALEDRSHLAAASIEVDLPAATPGPGTARPRPSSEPSGSRRGLLAGWPGSAEPRSGEDPGQIRVVSRDDRPEQALDAVRRACDSLLAFAAGHAAEVRETTLAELKMRRDSAKREKDVAAQAFLQAHDLDAVQGLPGPEVLRLEAQASRARESLDLIHRRLQALEALDAQALAAGKVRPSAPAIVPRNASRERERGWSLLFWGLAAALGLSASVLWDGLDTRFRTPREVEDRLRLPVLAAIPPLRRPGHLPPRLGPAEAEGFLTAASRLQALARELEIRSITVTSALAGEGKSAVAVHVAIALAGRGMRILLADSNPERPSLHALFRLENEFGLADLAAEINSGAGSPNEAAARLEESRVRLAVRRTAFPNLEVVLAGRGGDAEHRLDRETLRPLVLRLCRQADLVICDGPAVSAGKEAVGIAAATDAALLVVEARRAEEHQVACARRFLLEAQASVLGVIFTRSKTVHLTGGHVPEDWKHACQETRGRTANVP